MENDKQNCESISNESDCICPWCDGPKGTYEELCWECEEESERRNGKD